MTSVLFGLICLMVPLVIFWSTKYDRIAPDQIRGPFAIRRRPAEPTGEQVQSDGPIARK